MSRLALVDSLGTGAVAGLPAVVKDVSARFSSAGGKYRGELSAVGDSEFGEDSVEVGADCAVGEEQPFADFSV
ncbi:hypothetical protein GCM10027568_17960 [Humibacter soli]